MVKGTSTASPFSAGRVTISRRLVTAASFPSAGSSRAASATRKTAPECSTMPAISSADSRVLMGTSTPPASGTAKCADQHLGTVRCQVRHPVTASADPAPQGMGEPGHLGGHRRVGERPGPSMIAVRFGCTDAARSRKRNGVSGLCMLGHLVSGILP